MPDIAAALAAISKQISVALNPPSTVQMSAEDLLKYSNEQIVKAQGETGSVQKERLSALEQVMLSATDAFAKDAAAKFDVPLFAEPAPAASATAPVAATPAPAAVAAAADAATVAQATPAPAPTAVAKSAGAPAVAGSPESAPNIIWADDDGDFSTGTPRVSVAKAAATEGPYGTRITTDAAAKAKELVKTRMTELVAELEKAGVTDVSADVSNGYASIDFDC